MGFQWREGNIDINTQDIRPEDTSLYPVINFTFQFTNRYTKLLNINPTFHVRILKERYYYIGTLINEQPWLDLQPKFQRALRARLVLDPYGLQRIEKLRENGDVNFNIYAYVTVEETEIFQKGTTSFSCECKISKSDWVEVFLSKFDYKHVSLIEIPVIDDKSFQNVVNNLDLAWKQKCMGQYDSVLVYCRKVIEELGTVVMKMGFKIEREKEGPLPNWEKFFNDEDTGDIIGTINKKIVAFTNPGAHPGSSINLEDADYALMITHAITNLIIKKMPKNNDKGISN